MRRRLAPFVAERVGRPAADVRVVFTPNACFVLRPRFEPCNIAPRLACRLAMATSGASRATRMPNYVKEETLAW